MSILWHTDAPTGSTCGRCLEPGILRVEVSDGSSGIRCTHHAFILFAEAQNQDFLILRHQLQE